jgi:hypothetical protein
LREREEEVPRDQGFLQYPYLHDIVKNRTLLWSPSNRVFIVKPGKEGEVISRMIRAGVFFTNTPSLHKRVSRSFRGVIRNYQREALQSWRSNGFKGIIALPTGSGKTVYTEDREAPQTKRRENSNCL